MGLREFVRLYGDLLVLEGDLRAKRVHQWAEVGLLVPDGDPPLVGLPVPGLYLELRADQMLLERAAVLGLALVGFAHLELALMVNDYGRGTDCAELVDGLAGEGDNVLSTLHVPAHSNAQR